MQVWEKKSGSIICKGMYLVLRALNTILKETSYYTDTIILKTKAFSSIWFKAVPSTWISHYDAYVTIRIGSKQHRERNLPLYGRNNPKKKALSYFCENSFNSEDMYLQCVFSNLHILYIYSGLRKICIFLFFRFIYLW